MTGPQYPHVRERFGSSAAIVLAILALSQVSAELSDTDFLRDKFGFTTHRSASGRFITVGPDESVNMTTAAWADELSERVERVVGIDASFKKREFRVILRQSGATSDVGQVEYTQEMSKGVLIQRMLLTGVSNAVREDSEETFCRLMLNGYIFARTGSIWDKRDVAGPRAPEWLCVGLAQNLYPSTRTRNGTIVLKKWRDGKLLRLDDVLVHSAKRGDEPLDRAICGVFTGWLLSLPESAERFLKLFELLAAGERVTVDWLTGVIPSCETSADVYDQWDLWMIRERQMVRDPGTAGGLMLERLKANLALYHGESGIPLKGGDYVGMPLAGLIAEKDAKWIPGFVKSKTSTLRFLAVGRSKDFGNVVEAYCTFFDGLNAGKDRNELIALLDKANNALDEFQKKNANTR